MKTKEIEIQECVLSSNNAVVCYTISDGITYTDIDGVVISKSDLIEHIEDNNLNVLEYVIDGDIDEDTFDAETYLSENLDYVLKSYLEENHANL